MLESLGNSNWKIKKMLVKGAAHASGHKACNNFTVLHLFYKKYI